MPFSRPALSELRDRVAQDIAAGIPGADALLRFSNLKVTGDALAGLAHLHYGYLDWIARQAVPFTASQEFLEAWAGLKNILRKPASAASGTVTFTGTEGAVVPAGTAVLRGDGVAYATTEDATVGAGGTVAVSVTADEPAAAGNADAGTAMTLGAAIAGVQSNGSVTTALTGGADIEDDDALRTRMLARYQAPPQGGARDDYPGWALEVAGVTRAWVTPNGMGAGTVVVYVMLDEAEAAHDGFPQGTDGVATDEPRDVAAAGDQLLVADHIFAVQPVTALVYVVAPIANPVAFTIAGVPVGSRAAVEAAITDVFRRDGTPGGTIEIDAVWAAVEAVSGAAGFDINVPADDIVSPTGHLPTLGTVTWA